MSSLKSVPVAQSRQSTTSKLRLARAALETQTGAASVLHDDEMPASPGSSSESSVSPHSTSRKMAGKKSAQKRTAPSSEMSVVIYIYIYNVVSLLLLPAISVIQYILLHIVIYCNIICYDACN